MSAASLDSLAGPRLLRAPHAADARGGFTKPYGEWLTDALGPDTFLTAEVATSFNSKRGTLRGLHFQAAPHTEAKIVHCLRGEVWDVVVDLRTGSPTFGRWAAVTLAAGTAQVLYVPRGFAHGFQTLRADSEVLYLLDRPYRSESVSGVRWDDPRLAIDWPLSPVNVSERDQGLPALSDVAPPL